MKYTKQFVTEFLKYFTSAEVSNDILVLNFSYPQIIDFEDKLLRELKHEIDFEKVKSENFSLVIGDLPVGMQSEVTDTISKLNVNKNWNFVLKSLRLLNDNGQALYLIEPSILFSKKGKRFLQELELENYYLNSVFELPDKFLNPETVFQPIIVHFERQIQTDLLIGQITNDFEYLISTLKSKKSTNNIANGIIVKRNEFESFHKYRIEVEMDNLQTQYKNYSKYKLKEVAFEITSTRDIFQNRDNSIYIPKIGTSSVVANLEDARIKHHNLFQVVLNPDIVKAGYLVLFFHSFLGKQILKSLTSGSFIPNINKSDIETCFVSIPSLLEQSLLIQTNEKLTELQEIINELKAELSLNPQNAVVILDKFESIQSPLKKLSIEDQILSLIRKGENKHVEFKETFLKNIRTGQKDDDIKKTALKNIVGFLNADGGHLLIGIADSGEIKGVEGDFFKSADNYKLNFKNEIHSKIGAEFYSLINYELFNVSGHQVLKVDCKASSEPCFYNQTEFFVRTNPATDKLEGKKQYDYIKERFKI